MVVSVGIQRSELAFVFFLVFSLRVNPILNVSLTSLLHVSLGGVVFYASYEAGLTLSNSCQGYREHR